MSSGRRQGPAAVYRPDPDYENASRAQAVECHRCGEYLVFTPDFLGRLRERCPRCDGVARRQLLEPPRLVTEEAYTLPPIADGQLRCQRCARGTKGNARYCARCRKQNWGRKPGFHHSPTTRAKIAERARGRKRTPEEIAKMIATRRANRAAKESSNG